MFGSFDEVELALESEEVNLLAPIRLRVSGELLDLTTMYDDQDVLHCQLQQLDSTIIETSVGRVIFIQRLPEGLPFFNGLLKKRGLGQVVEFCHLHYGNEMTVRLVDRLKEVGFLYATLAGISIGIDDMVIPKMKASLVEQARQRQIAVEEDYQGGSITNGERYNQVTDRRDVPRRLHLLREQQQQLVRLELIRHTLAAGADANALACQAFAAVHKLLFAVDLHPDRVRA